MKTKILLLTCLSLSGLFATAGSNENAMLKPGDSYTYYHYFFNESNFEPGLSPGNGIDWLFQNTPDESAFVVEVKDASAHPDASNFPSADLVITNDFFSTDYLGALNKNYHFIQSTSNSFVKYGRVDIDETTNNTYVNIFNNPEIQVVFPLAVGLNSHDNWSGAYYVPERNGSVYWSNGSNTYEATDIGTISINGKIIDDVTRVVRRRVYAENAAFIDFKLHDVTYYEWYVEGMAFPIVSLMHKKGFSGNPDEFEGYFIDNAHLATVGINEAKNDISTLQLYPNPSNGEINIRYELFNPSFVEISVYNTNGVKVERIVETEQDAGEYHINQRLNLSSGMYLINFKHNGRSETKTVVINDRV
ncbi:MAG TPA: hypothetical protein DCX54_03740 [Flavobacteriales bacterium]|nr:hypothetical protein [Flavobacteriales bacterium]